MNLTAYTIDDEAHALDVLAGYTKLTPGIELIGSSLNPLIALQELSDGLSPDLLLVDIDMPELNGLALAGMLKHRCKIVFTTSYREYGPEAFELAAADYLLKPIRYERFLACIQKIRSELAPTLHQLPEDHAFFVKSGNKGKLVKIIPDEIVYIEAAQNYMHIVTTQGKIITYMSTQQLQDQLPGSYFLRVHKSFTINTRRIRGFDRAIITMDDKSAIPLGRAYRTAFLNNVPGINGG